MKKLFQNLVRYRELLYFLVLREIKSKYKQTILGVSWSILQPLALMLTFTIVFSLFARLPSDGVPYALFSYCALLPWQFFAGVLGRASGSLLSNQALVQKVYFPREIIPLAVVISAVVDFFLGGVLFLGLLWFYAMPWSAYYFLIIPVFLIQFIFVVGVILVLSPLNVFYRDIGHAIPLLMQIWMFATPIIYPLSIVPEHLRPYYILNPMAGIIDGYRQILLHNSAPDMPSLTVALVISTGMLILGSHYFKRVEFRLADVI